MFYDSHKRRGRTATGLLLSYITFPPFFVEGATGLPSRCCQWRKATLLLFLVEGASVPGFAKVLVTKQATPATPPVVISVLASVGGYMPETAGLALSR